MRKTVFLILLIALGAFPALAQTVSGPITAASASCLPTNCVLYVIPVLSGTTGQIATATVQVAGATFVATLQAEATVDNSNWVPITGSPVSAAGGVSALTAAGVWQFNVAGLLGFRIRASAFTNGPLTVSIQASLGMPSVGGASATGQPVNTVATSGSTTQSAGVMGAAVAVNLTTVAPFGTITTALQGMHCNNSNIATVTLSATNGANVYFIGPNFSMPGLSQYDLPSGLVGHVMASGVNLSAGTAGSINCWLEGKQ